MAFLGNILSNLPLSGQLSFGQQFEVRQFKIITH